MNRSVLIAGVIVALVLIGGAAFIFRGTQDTNEPEVSEQTPTNPAESPTASPTSESTQSGTTTTGMTRDITVEAGAFFFNPKEIKVKKGEIVRLTLKNTGGQHDFVIDDLKVRTKVLQAGQQEVVTFTADKAGSFEYYCSVGNHRQMGMKGTLIVE